MTQPLANHRSELINNYTLFILTCSFDTYYYLLPKQIGLYCQKFKCLVTDRVLSLPTTYMVSTKLNKLENIGIIKECIQ